MQRAVGAPCGHGHGSGDDPGEEGAKESSGVHERITITGDIERQICLRGKPRISDIPRGCAAVAAAWDSLAKEETRISRILTETKKAPSVPFRELCVQILLPSKAAPSTSFSNGVLPVAKGGELRHLGRVQGVVAIVGRPNVGKSALFNRLVGRRIAIVHDQPGVTRDRVMAEAEWRGRPFTLMDTGGIGLLRGERAEDVITAAAFDQVQLALESAQVILFVVNVQDGVVPLDLEVARRLRGAGKPVLVVANKADNESSAEDSGDFARLGFETVLPVSAIHGRGIEELLTAVIPHLPAVPSAGETDPSPEGEAETGAESSAADSPPPKEALLPRKHPLRLAIVGRPNVGKSSLINALIGSQRVIVSPVPGTTRDAVEIPFEVVTEGRRESYVLVDTAGLRKARRVSDTVEYFSAERTRDAIERADVVVLVVDAETNIVEQDKKIADLITASRRACILVVNKWDLVSEAVKDAQDREFARRRREGTYGRPRQQVTLGDFGEWVHEKLFFLDYAPVIFTSARDGFQLDRLLEAVRFVAAQLDQKVPTAVLNRTLADAIARRQPVSALGHRLKFFYATQVRLAPPTFLAFVNRAEPFSPAYEKYLTGELRKAFGYEGCPIVIVPRARPKTIETIRRDRHATGPRSESRPPARSGGAGKGSGGSRRPAPRGKRPAAGSPRSRTRQRGRR
ncbi:MAG: ribosome biogenesis GTPase Der [Verrucomicrobiae bacterium]|nr:ribosome biogenesis GTPase Der [Verrucomicrobiae bacterium]